jgi:lysophospholipase L1-like esterase
MRIWIFRLIAVCLPLVLLLLIELGLRLASYGRDIPLFITNPTHPDYILPRPDIIQRYFPANAPTPKVSMEANFLLRDKPNNGLRIVVQGGSTAAGYPYGWGASIAGMLDHRIRASEPQRYVEVVNTAMSAVNSYTLLDFADEIIAQQPDAVLIYAGHNEYLGILGVGSNFSMTGSALLTRWYLRLQHLRLFQLVQNTLYALQQAPADKSATDVTQTNKHNLGQTSNNQRTLMSQVAKERNIELDSALFDAGITQFEANMTRLLDKYQRAGVPVLLSTIASNELDQAPFVSVPVPEALQSELNALPALHQTLSAQAISAHVQQLLAKVLDSDSADAHFALGRMCAQMQQIRCARHALAQAIELDALRFRAPQAINQVITTLAQRDGVYLVDSQARLRARHPQGLIGKNVMLEHLHPNVAGYFVIANAFYDTLYEHVLPATNKTVPINTAWQRRPIIPSEEYVGFADILALTSDYPFSKTPKPFALPKPSNWEERLGLDKVERKTDWLSMQRQALARYQSSQQEAMATKTQRIIADALPHDPVENLRAAQRLLKAQRLPEALYYFQRAKRAGTMNIDSVIARLEKALGQS